MSDLIIVAGVGLIGGMLAGYALGAMQRAELRAQLRQAEQYAAWMQARENAYIRQIEADAVRHIPNGEMTQSRGVYGPSVTWYEKVEWGNN